MEVATSSVLLLPYTASSVGVARRRLIGDLTDAGAYETTACDAGLVLSELISNALRHASPLPGAQVRVAWRLHPNSVEVAVSDGGGATVPAVSEPASSAVGGRGLGIVQRLSLRWGVCTDMPGDGDAQAGSGDAQGGSRETTVWAEIALHFGDGGKSVTEPEGANPGITHGKMAGSSHLVIASSRDA
jgi:anti-sigma regulatory factor (Ser/Thr protein kinase)